MYRKRSENFADERKWNERNDFFPLQIVKVDKEKDRHFRDISLTWSECNNIDVSVCTTVARDSGDRAPLKRMINRWITGKQISK